MLFHLVSEIFFNTKLLLIFEVISLTYKEISMKKIIIFFVLFSTLSISTRAGIVTTIAGNGISGYSADGAVATAARIGFVLSIAVDAVGNVYFAEYDSRTIRKIDTAGVLTTIAGNGAVAEDSLLLTGSEYTSEYYTTYVGPATAVPINLGTAGLVIDRHGNIYFIDNADGIEGKIKKIDTSGILSTVAGGIILPEDYQYYEEPCPAIGAFLNTINGLAVDSIGNLYISNSDGYVHKVDTSGIISIIGGSGVLSTCRIGDGGPATLATIYPHGIVTDQFGNIFFVEYETSTIRKISPSGIITTVAGYDSTNCYCAFGCELGSDATVSSGGYSGDGGPATAAYINGPYSLFIDNAGNIVFTDFNNNRIRKINSAGVISTVGGNGSQSSTGYNGDGYEALFATIKGPYAIAKDATGNIYFSENGTSRIRKISVGPTEISDSFSVVTENSCGGLNFSLTAHSFASGQHFKTYFGTGSYLDTATTLVDTSGNVSFFEPYTTSGTYTIKHVLYSGSVAVDSIMYSQVVRLCQDISANFYYDLPGSCIYSSATDALITLPVSVEIDSNSVPVDTVSATSGLNYLAYGNPGTVYTLRILAASSGLAVTCPPTGIIADTLIPGSPIVNNFGFSCSGSSAFDLSVHANINTGRHRQTMYVSVNNSYCDPTPATLNLIVSPKYNLYNVFPAPASVIGNSITWNLTPISMMTPTWNFSVELDTSIWLIPGDTVQTRIMITPVAGDADTSNNVIIRADTVKSSFDPNEMAVYPTGNILPGTNLQYTVQFENTGNDTAHNIYVLDTLSDNTDVNSMTIVSSSSVMYTTMLHDSANHKIVKFAFPGINLLDSSHHGLCDGMVIFNIKTISGLTEGTTIYNHASIFFDDNPAVITDTVVNNIAFIHGSDALCAGAATTFTENAQGGVWSSSNASATVVAGVVTGISPGLDTISYTITVNSFAVSTTKIITINPGPPAVGIISGVTTVCIGSYVELTDTTNYGTWMTSNGHAVVFGSSTIVDVSGISTGLDTIEYTKSNSCGSTTATKVITVSGLSAISSQIITTVAGN